MANILDELEKLKPDQLASVYLLSVKDLYLEQETINTLSMLFSQKVNSAVEKKIFRDEDDQDQTFIQSLSNLEMFASYQIVVYKNIHKLSTSYQTLLLQYLKNPAKTTLLILTADSKSRSNFLGSIKNHSLVQTLAIWTPWTSEFPGIIVKQFAKNGYQIEPEALDALADSTNDSLAHTFSEIEKLMIYLGERTLVTAADVRRVGGGEKTYQMADFIHAIAEQNHSQSIQICLNLIETGATTPFFVSALFNFFINVWAYQQIHKNAQNSTYQSKKSLKQYKLATAKYHNHDFASLFRDLLDTDLKAKSTSLTANDLMIPLICNILKA